MHKSQIVRWLSTEPRNGNFVNGIGISSGSPLCLWPDSSLSPSWSFPRVFQLPFFSPRPSYITANFRPTLETFEQLLVFERPPCFIIRTLSLSLSSHSSIRESLAVPIRGRNLGRFIASVSDTVVIFTPGITFKGYICITEKLGKWGNWGISGGLIYCGVMKSFMEVSRGVVRIFPLPIFKKEIFVLRNTNFFWNISSLFFMIWNIVRRNISVFSHEFSVSFFASYLSDLRLPFHRRQLKQTRY